MNKGESTLWKPKNVVTNIFSKLCNFQLMPPPSMTIDQETPYKVGTLVYPQHVFQWCNNQFIFVPNKNILVTL
jgi:hypothetical protein